MAVSGARPQLELTVGVEEGAKDLGDERPRVHRLAVDVLIIARIAFEVAVELAGEHNSHMNRAKGFTDACELHVEPPKLLRSELNWLQIESGK
jgi:hypothetical protein